MASTRTCSSAPAPPPPAGRLCEDIRGRRLRGPRGTPAVALQRMPERRTPARTYESGGFGDGGARRWWLCRERRSAGRRRGHPWLEASRTEGHAGGGAPENGGAQTLARAYAAGGVGDGEVSRGGAGGGGLRRCSWSTQIKGCEKNGKI
jgi:hypothetical protein